MTREEIIKGVKGCVGMYYGFRCGECPYGPYSSDCVESLHRDVERLLKAQEPQVMTLEEVLLLGDNDFVFIETRLAGNTKVKPAIYQPDNSSDDEGDGYCCIVSSWGSSGFYHRENYNQSWRCWTSRPTDEQREATPWH